MKSKLKRGGHTQFKSRLFKTVYQFVLNLQTSRSFICVTYLQITNYITDDVSLFLRQAWCIKSVLWIKFTMHLSQKKKKLVNQELAHFSFIKINDY